MIEPIYFVSNMCAILLICASLVATVKCCSMKSHTNKHTTIDNSVKSVSYPFKAMVKGTQKIITITSGQLNYNGTLWLKFQSNFEDDYTVYLPEELLSLPKIDTFNKN